MGPSLIVGARFQKLSETWSRRKREVKSQEGRAQSVVVVPWKEKSLIVRYSGFAVGQMAALVRPD